MGVVAVAPAATELEVLVIPRSIVISHAPNANFTIRACTHTHSDLKNIDSSELGADRCTLKNVHYVCSYLLIRNRPTLCLK